MPRPREFDEQRVLAAVQAAFWDRGYAGTSLEDLVAASGLGKGSLYGAFGDKRRLFLRVLRDYDDANDRVLRDRLEHAERGIDVVRDFVTGAVGDPDGGQARRGCLRTNAATELATSIPEVAEETRRSYDATVAVLADAVRRAQGEGDVATGVEPDQAARALLAGQVGMLVLARAGQDPAVLSRLADTLLGRLLAAS